MKKAHLLAAALPLLVFHTAGFAEPERSARNAGERAQPEAYRQLVACRDVTDSPARLACYDHQIEALEQATSKHDIVISDKAAVKEAQRGLFGFAAPVAKLMGFGGDRDDELKEINTKVSSVRRNEAGWVLEFDDGSTWEQNDTRDFVLSPKIGNDAKIARGVLGTFTVSVRDQRPIKMRRVR